MSSFDFLFLASRRKKIGGTARTDDMAAFHSMSRVFLRAPGLFKPQDEVLPWAAEGTHVLRRRVLLVITGLLGGDTGREIHNFLGVVVTYRI